jgi:uncharacterized FlgJ-related protein
MRLVLFNPKSLEYKSLTTKPLIVFGCFVLIASSIISFIIIRNLDNVRYISEETRQILINENSKFSEKELKKLILELNLKFPHIVLAQAKLESGLFKSKIFFENNNLFGMKVATTRPTTNTGEQYQHAVFNNWRESVIDYGFYQARYLSNIKTEAQYLDYLRQSYAEDSNYVNKLKIILAEK